MAAGRGRKYVSWHEGKEEEENMKKEEGKK